MKNNNSAADTKAKLTEMAYAYVISRAIHVAASLGIADHLVEGSKTAEELAGFTGANPKALYRLLRTLASQGIFTEVKENSFALTPLAELLITSNPDSQRLLFMKEDETRWNAYGDLMHSIKTGQPAYNHLYGMGYFDYISKNPEACTVF